MMDISKTTFEVTGDQHRALISTQQAGVTLVLHFQKRISQLFSPSQAEETTS